MRNELSSLLIAWLLLLSPVSFASENIPDFSPDCSVTSVSVSVIAVAPLDGSTYDRVFPLQPEKQEFTIIPTIISLFDKPQTAIIERAPPA
jgi:hypothetical protein